MPVSFYSYTYLPTIPSKLLLLFISEIYFCAPFLASLFLCFLLSLISIYLIPSERSFAQRQKQMSSGHLSERARSGGLAERSFFTSFGIRMKAQWTSKRTSAKRRAGKAIATSHLESKLNWTSKINKC